MPCRLRAFVIAAVLAGGAFAPAQAAPAPTVLHQGAFRIAFDGLYDPNDAPLDADVENWMQANGIHAAQLAFRKAGKLLFSHAYAYGAERVYPTVTPDNVMRLASVSKMMPTAAVTTLYAQHVLSPGTRVFPFLGIAKPLLRNQHPDPNIDRVTVQELVDHTGGFHGEGAGDPLFTMREIELSVGKEPLTKRQFASYVYGLPLLFKPGTQSLYSNVGYTLLGMVVEKATGMRFIDYMNAAILEPLGIGNVSLGATRYADRNPAEVVPNDPYVGASIFDLSKNPQIGPFDYDGGDIVWEDADSAADFETNAESISRFIHSYNVYGLGGRQADYARSGCVPGVATWAESLSNDVDFALLFNAQPCLDFTSSVIGKLRAALGAL